MRVAEEEIVLQARENFKVRSEDFIKAKCMTELLVAGEDEKVRKERKEGDDKLSKLDLSKVRP